MAAYESYRRCEHLLRQAVDRFGQASDQAQRMRTATDYWFGQWVEDGCKVISPPADILEARIKDEEKAIKRRSK